MASEYGQYALAIIKILCWFIPREVVSCAFKMYNSVANKRLKCMVWKMFWIRVFLWKWILWVLCCRWLTHPPFIPRNTGYTCKTPFKLIAEFCGARKQNTGITESSSQISMTTESANIQARSTSSLDWFGRQLSILSLAGLKVVAYENAFRVSQLQK